MDQLRSEGNQSANEQSLNIVVEAEALRQVSAFRERSSDLQVELTKMRYTDATNFQSVAKWLVAKTKVYEGSAKAPAVVAIELSRAWLETIWGDEDGVDELITLKTALEWMQVSLAGCAEITTLVKPEANGKISCHITLAGILAVGQAPKTIDCDSLSNFLSSTKNLWTTKGKDRELRKLLENILIEAHLGLIE